VQNPGFNLGNAFAGVANFAARPEIDLVNPSAANGGVNGGNIAVLTNWNLGAGVVNSDGSYTRAYRYPGTIAPVIAIRAADNVRVDASITDGFFQAAAVSLAGSFTEITLYNGNTESIVGLDPNASEAAEQLNGGTQYDTDYEAYASELYGP